MFIIIFRCRLGVAMLGGKLYACGGYDGSSFLQTVEMFDPNTNKWVLEKIFNTFFLIYEKGDKF